MYNAGDFAPNGLVVAAFNTALTTGARGDFSSALEAADFRIYKGTSATERSSTAGITVSAPHDAMVGVHIVSVDLSDNTDAGFYEAGKEYTLVVYPDETIDSLAVSAAICTFSILRKTADTPIVGLAQAGSVGTVTLPTDAVASTDYYKGGFVTVASGTGAGQTREITAYSTGRLATISPNWTTSPSTNSVLVVTVAPPAISTLLDVNVMTVDAAAVTSIRDGLLNWVVFTGFTFARMLRVLGIVWRGTLSGGRTSTETFTAPAGGATVTATVDAFGNRTVVTDTASGTP